MKGLSYRLCVAPMMDRNDSFLISIRCNPACAQRVHEGTAIYFADVRYLAISADPQRGDRERLERSALESSQRRSGEQICLFVAKLESPADVDSQVSGPIRPVPAKDKRVP
jgi:hypothetical protein